MPDILSFREVSSTLVRITENGLVKQIVGMGINQHHAPCGLYTTRFLHPDPLVGLTQDHEQGVILGNGYWSSTRLSMKKGNHTAAASDRFVWIGVGIGRVIVEVQAGHPLPTSM